MKIINIEEIPSSHLNDDLNADKTIINDVNNVNDVDDVNENVDDYDLNVDRIIEDNSDEEDEDEEDIIMNYDGIVFDVFEEECQNKLCKGCINDKFNKFPRALFINGEIGICFICYILGYRPCMNTHLIMHSDDMECIDNLYYYK